MKLVLVIIAFACSAVLVSGHSHEVDELVGREVAAYGERSEISGTLVFQLEEWFIVQNGNEHEMHLGPFGHADTPPFTEGETATVDGFVYTDHIAPIRVTTESGNTEFWTAERMPIWAGQGEGGGRIAHQNDRIPQGARSAEQDRGEQLSDTPPGGRYAATNDPGFQHSPPGRGARR